MEELTSSLQLPNHQLLGFFLRKGKKKKKRRYKNVVKQFSFFLSFFLPVNANQILIYATFQLLTYFIWDFLTYLLQRKRYCLNIILAFWF